MSAVSKVFRVVFPFLVLLLGFNLMAIYFTEAPNQFHYKVYKTNDSNRNQNETIKLESLSEDECGQIFPCLTNGSWSLKNDLSAEDVRKRIRMDEFIYEYEGFHKTSVRSDGKCGKKFPPIPNGKLGSSVCDAFGVQPCCNEDVGQCGSTTEHCECNNCTDFRKYLPAEIAQWTTNSDKCRIKDFNHVEACRLFTQHVSEMLFVGDSLTRHIFTALALILTNDTAKGALNIKMNQKLRELCQGELQFIDSGKFNCHGVIAHRWEELPTVCGGKANFTISFQEDYNVNLLPSAINAVRILLNKTGSVVVFNVGVHMGYNSKLVIKNYVGPIVDMVKNNSNGWPKMIWHNLHEIENVLRSYYRDTYGKWRRFNAEMATYMKMKGISVMDSGQLTRGIKTYDPQHFGFAANTLKAQVLIKYLDKWFKMCKKYEV